MSEFRETTTVINDKRIIEIKNLSLPKDCKVIVAPDPSQNGGLLFLDKEGWTIDRIQNVYPDTISKLKTKGANYLILNDQNQIINSKDFGTTVYNEEGIKIIEL